MKTILPAVVCAAMVALLAAIVVTTSLNNAERGKTGVRNHESIQPSPSPTSNRENDHE